MCRAGVVCRAGGEWCGVVCGVGVMCGGAVMCGGVMVVWRMYGWVVALVWCVRVVCWWCSLWGCGGVGVEWWGGVVWCVVCGASLV